MKERIAYFDFLLGLAIMMVVGIHTYTLGKDSTVVLWQRCRHQAVLFHLFCGNDIPYVLAQNGKSNQTNGGYL